MGTDAPSPPSTSPSPLRVGLTAVCPSCGKGALYSRILTVSEHCSHCHLPLAQHDAGDGPAYFAMCILLVVVIAGAAMLELAVAPPLWVHMLVWFPLILAGSVWLLRVFKAILIAYDVRYRAEQYTPQDRGPLDD